MRMGKKYQPLYKKVNKSLLGGKLTIQKYLEKDFQAGKILKPRSSREIDIIWDNKKYRARFSHGITRGNHYFQLVYNSNVDLLMKLRKTFIQSYVILKSQKELFDEKEMDKQFRGKLAGGQQEVLIAEPIDSKTVKFKTFIRIKNDWNKLFQRLADENVFGWLFDKDKEHLIARSTRWHKVKEFNKHKNANGVIYYLANTKKQLLYIGKAENLGQRVQPGQQHQNMPGDWDMFRYDIVKDEYSNILERLEDHTIRAFASVLKNNKNYPSLNSIYKLLNSNWKKL